MICGVAISMIISAKLTAKNLRELKKIAEEFYFHEWRGHEKSAPAFGGEIVHTTRRGWVYITGKSAPGDVMRRLALLPIAREIIETIKDHDRKQTLYRRPLGGWRPAS
jgi:hypothetical protein